ncbi:MAG: undecaprenyl-diphosphate phosphatase [Candidatus Eisenbacteria bacterium]
MNPGLAPATASVLLVVLLGILQGLAEFLPISSSGHLVIAQELLRIPQTGIVLEVILHAATLAAVLIAYRGDLVEIVRGFVQSLIHLPSERRAAIARGREAWLLVLATLPAGIAGLALRKPIEAIFDRPQMSAGFLIVTGLLLLATRFARVRCHAVGARTALVMGCMQAVSLLPGISRSGASISGGMLAGADPVRAVRFSFLMSVPAILGSLVLEGPEVLRSAQSGMGAAYAAGFAAALISGLVAIRLLVWLTRRGRFHWFGFYCIAAGIGAWIWLAR